MRALSRAQAQVEQVRDDPAGRLTLLRELYRAPDAPSRHLPYRRAATAFMDWQLRRGVLEPPSAAYPGSPWWRSVNERLLRDQVEARALVLGDDGVPSSAAVAAGVAFVRRPTARTWYRAHNLSVASAYLEFSGLARAEGRVERLFLNVVLARVLLAHALVANPRLAIGPWAPVGPLLGDPRVGMTGIFLSLTRILPDRYPVGQDVRPYVEQEHAVGRVLDIGVMLPRLPMLYAWSAAELDLPGLTGLLTNGMPSYAWDLTDPHERDVWDLRPSGLTSLARRLVPISTSPDGLSPLPRGRRR